MSIRFGRLLALLSITGFIMVLALNVPSIQRAFVAGSASHGVLNTLIAFAAIATFLSWGLALYHLATRFRGSDSSRKRWGIALVFGAFVASWFYWLSTPQTDAEARPAR
jgi:apolipoprotein N-acyltransferase